MHFDSDLAVGAIGGHGPIRYFVEEYDPGRKVVFRFTGPSGFIGTHGFELETASPATVTVRHVLEMRPRGAAHLTWPFVFRPLHDALLEDALDCAETYVTGTAPSIPAQWSWYVRFLRGLLAGRRRDSRQQHA
jgi:hypothetical protein